MLTDEDIERAWLGDQTVAPRGGRITGFSRLASFARAIESAVRAEYADVPPEEWNGEGWESLAWHLCAEENGEDACNDLLWVGGAVPEPWGDRWQRYEGDAKRMIRLVKEHYNPKIGGEE
jgi:hypothetical protein